MNLRQISQIVLSLIALPTLASARGVNINNTWMLPEEGFPVFYRYFRDRISWYEADAVCQFHHATLVTADSSSQYDAIRAYLKELDITENVWIGLSKATESSNFMWTSFRPLNGDGHWEQQIPQGKIPLCVSMDPAADFLWKVRNCGGPEVASFICELPVPSWATGPRGCLLTELPSMTVLYIPEQLALELTSDCGLDGTKKISCQGNADREEILRQLSCNIPSEDIEDKSTKSSNTVNVSLSTPSNVPVEEISFNTKTTKPWIWTSNTVDTDYGMPTRHRRETEDTISPSSTRSTSHILTTELVHVESTSGSSGEEAALDPTGSQATGKPIKEELVQVTTVESSPPTTESDYFTSEPRITEREDSIEFPTGINQSHLFRIIENGTMFDLIEVNETSEDPKLRSTYAETTNISTAYSVQNGSGSLYTTVIYNKEPPLESNYVTNKSLKKFSGMRDGNDPKKMLSYSKRNELESRKVDRTLTKEVELNPIATDMSLRLNRTFRKELPFKRERASKNESEDTKLITGGDKHKHVEIKWREGEDSSSAQKKLFVTTRNADLSTLQKPKNGTLQKSALNQADLVNASFAGNNAGETFSAPKPAEVEGQQPLSAEDGASPVPNEFLGSEPQPRPNRQRQLTRTQRRSFYPYFFSRVLG